jgi:hypothetical protein
MSAIGQTGTVAPTPSGDATGTPPGTGQAATPPEQAQQQQQQQRPNGFWGRFPNVPEDQRAVLEPHLKEVQRYVTRMEQQYVAPFKGYTPQQVQGLANFAKNFDANPLQVFLNMAQQLQQTGIIHDNLDLESLALIATGQDLPDDVAGASNSNENDPWADAPPWALQIKARQDAEEQQRQESQRAEAERRENAVLDHSIKTLREKMVSAGFPEELANGWDERDLVARFITHNGSVEGVLKTLNDVRAAILKGAVQPNENDPTLPNGVPPTSRTPLQRRAAGRKGDPFAQASAAAEQQLRRSLRQ